MTEIKGSFGRGRDAERRRRLDELQRLMPHLPIEEITRIFGALNTLAFAPACDAIRIAIDAARVQQLTPMTPAERMKETLRLHPPKPLLPVRYRDKMLEQLRFAVVDTFGMAAAVFDEAVDQNDDYTVKLSKPRMDVRFRTLTANGGSFTVRTSTCRRTIMQDEWQAIAEGNLKFLLCGVEHKDETHLEYLVLVDLFQLYLQSSKLKAHIKDCVNKHDDTEFIRCSIADMPDSVVIWKGLQ